MQGIMFVEPLFRKVVTGDKTITRRIALPVIDKDSGFVFDHKLKRQYDIHNWKERFIEENARYKIDEVVYLKEPYLPKYFDGGGTAYGFDWNESAAELLTKPKFKNKMFMGAKYARYFIKVVDVRIEQVHDISQEQAKAEGVIPCPHRPSSEGCKPHYDNNLIRDCYYCAFRVIWNQINGKTYPWHSNPWVFVYKFELI